MNPFVIIKNEEDGRSKHKIEVYIGGFEGTDLFFAPPIITTQDGSRLLFPNEARLKDISYLAKMYAHVDIRYITTGSDEPVEERLSNVLLANIPVMLHSCLCNVPKAGDVDKTREVGECPYDQGGYFIVDGKEKVVIPQESVAFNKLFVKESETEKYSHTASIRCRSESSSVFPKTHSFYVYGPGARQRAITVKIPHIEIELPIFMLFRALGVESDLDIIKHIASTDKTDPRVVEYLIACAIDGNMLYSHTTVVKFLSSYVEYKTVNSVTRALMQDLLPHVPFPDRAKHLGQLVGRLIDTCIGKADAANRDNYENKRVSTTGVLFFDIFKDFYNDFRVSARSAIDHEYESMWKNKKTLRGLVTSKFLYSDKLRFGLVKSLKSNFGLVDKKFAGQDPTDGVVQDLNRISYMGFISHLRRVSLPMDTSIKIRKPHQLNGTHWGFMCPCESPDGPSIGLIKNLAILCTITFDVDSTHIRNVLRDTLVCNEFKIVEVSDMACSTMYDSQHVRLLINNVMYGVVGRHPSKLVEMMRLMRRTALINIFTSVTWNIRDNEINVSTEGGRCCRPLLIVDSGSERRPSRKPRSWNSRVRGGIVHPTAFSFSNDKYDDGFMKSCKSVDKCMREMREKSCTIEFVDALEMTNVVVAMTPGDIDRQTYTHMEIHPTTAFSAYTSTIPFANHNQAPRNIFSGSQGKQAVGVFATNFNNRIEPLSYVLHHSQKPLVTTRYAKYINNDKMTNGENVIVAIAAYSGYNQEDSIIINKSAVERGLFDMTYFHAHTSAEDTSGESKVIFANPIELQKEGKDVTNNSRANYETLDERGFPKIGAVVGEGDAILGRCVVSKKDGGSGNDRIFEDAAAPDCYETRTDVGDKTSYGIVDKVVAFNKDGERNVKIRMRSTRQPELGDKFSSRHGQKGVIGMVMPSEDMPFTAEGLVPDLIINPHAFPSRMTIAHLIECVLSKSAATCGFDCDGTLFEDHTESNEAIFDKLQEKGFSRSGDEVMYCGFMGEQMKASIFIGPTYYFRLKHMIADKQNWRATGKVMQMTRQPTQGRKNAGGLRFSDMEMTLGVAHGMSGFLKETYIDRSDKYLVPVIARKGEGAGVLTGPVSTINEYPDVPEITGLTIPYAFKVFGHELQTMAIGMRYVFDDIEEEHVQEDDWNEVDD